MAWNKIISIKYAPRNVLNLLRSGTFSSEKELFSYDVKETHCNYSHINVSTRSPIHPIHLCINPCIYPWPVLPSLNTYLSIYKHLNCVVRSNGARIVISDHQLGSAQRLFPNGVEIHSCLCSISISHESTERHRYSTGERVTAFNALSKHTSATMQVHAHTNSHTCIIAYAQAFVHTFINTFIHTCNCLWLGLSDSIGSQGRNSNEVARRISVPNGTSVNLLWSSAVEWKNG